MPIPKHATRVFEGEIFDVYQWEQELFDGTTATFERLKRPATVLVIPVMGDKLLIANERQPDREASMTLFGGRQEKGEDPLVTAKRELLEETGLTSEEWQQWRMYDIGGKIDWQIYAFIARECVRTGEPQLDGGEEIEEHALDFDQFIETVTDATFRDQLVSNELYRLNTEGKLEEFRQALFG